MDTRRLLLGDWTPVVRDGIEVLRLAILGGAVVHAVAGDWGAAALLALLGGVTVVARIVNLPRLYDLSLTVAMALQRFGEVLGLYDQRIRFDDLVRDTLGSLVGAALLVVWARVGWGSVRRIPGLNTHEDVDA